MDTEKKTQTRRPWEAGDRDWSNVSTSQETPRIADTTGSKERDLEQILPQSPQNEPALQTPWFWFWPPEL